MNVGLPGSSWLGMAGSKDNPFTGHGQSDGGEFKAVRVAAGDLAREERRHRRALEHHRYLQSRLPVVALEPRDQRVGGR